MRQNYTKIAKNADTWSFFDTCSKLEVAVATFCQKVLGWGKNHHFTFGFADLKTDCYNQLPTAYGNQKQRKSNAQNFVLGVACKQCSHYCKHHCGDDNVQDIFGFDKPLFEVQCQCDQAHRQKTDEIDALDCFLFQVQKGKQRHKHGTSAHAHTADDASQKSK